MDITKKKVDLKNLSMKNFITKYKISKKIYEKILTIDEVVVYKDNSDKYTNMQIILYSGYVNNALLGYLTYDELYLRYNVIAYRKSLKYIDLVRNKLYDRLKYKDLLKNIIIRKIYPTDIDEYYISNYDLILTKESLKGILKNKLYDDEKKIRSKIRLYENRRFSVEVTHSIEKKDNISLLKTNPYSYEQMEFMNELYKTYEKQVYYPLEKISIHTI